MYANNVLEERSLFRSEHAAKRVKHITYRPAHQYNAARKKAVQ